MFGGDRKPGEGRHTELGQLRGGRLTQLIEKYGPGGI